MADISKLKLPNGTEYNLKDVLGRKEAYLEWGGKNFAASYGPIDAAMIPNLGANRFAFLNIDGITIEYTRDAGVTWIDYGASAQSTGSLFTPTKIPEFYIGKADSSNKATENEDRYQLRIDIDTSLARIYTALNKYVFYISTNGSADCTVSLYAATHGNPNTYSTRFENVPISGWAGYNIVNCSSIITYGTSNSHYRYLRFVFKANGGNTNYNGLTLHNIMAFGGVGWTAPSTMAKYGYLYSMDYLQNATFPANVTATNFVGKINNHTVNSDVPANAKFTDTTYSPVTDTEDGLMLSEDKAKLDKLVVRPLMSKTFTGVIGTAADWNNGVFFYGKIIPTAFHDLWKITYVVRAEAAGSIYAKGYYHVTISGSADALIAYTVWNQQKSTNYRPIYYQELYRAKEAGITNNYGHLLGWRIFSSWNAATAANARTISVDIIDCENCTFTFFDSALKYAACPGTGSTNYSGYTELDAANNGITTTGDKNDVNYQNRFYYSGGGVIKTANAGGRYTLTFSKNMNEVVPITSTDNKISGEAKTYTTESFDPFGEIYYRNSSASIAANDNVANATLYRQIMVDARYSFTGILNRASSIMSVGKPVYIVCVPQSNGQVKLYSNPLSFTAPTTDDGLLYILLGYAANTYQFELLLHKPVYHFKNGALRTYNGSSTSYDSTTETLSINL